MLLLAIALAVAPDAQPSAAARARYEECLGSYAQVEMMGRKSAATIAMEAIQVCGREQTVFQQRFLRNSVSENMDALAVENAAIARRLIGFINRNR